jgi:ATP synthase A chain
MHLSSDELVLWQHGFFKLNVTIVTTWVLMFVLAVGAKLITRKLAGDVHISRWQSLLEIIVTNIRKQIEEVGLRHPEKYLGFLGTLFLFIALSNLCTIFPGYEPPTGSLSTTAALALCVFVAVPLFGIAAAVQHHQRTLAHTGPGHPPVRQHDERNDDTRHIADHHALHLSDRHEYARPAHRYGASLHFYNSCHGLHRGCHASPAGSWRLNNHCHNERNYHG